MFDACLNTDRLLAPAVGDSVVSRRELTGILAKAVTMSRSTQTG